MSLKAKLEAVIYAAEEPVTLAQLSVLFAADALEWKAAQAAAAAEQAAEVAGEMPATAESLPFLAEGLEYLGLEETPPGYAESVAEIAAAEATEPTDSTGVSGSEAPTTEDQSATESGAIELAADEAEVVIETAVDVEAEARRLARLRDREIKAILKQLLDELIAGYEADGRGVEIREIAGGYRMATKPECHDAVRMFVKSLKPPMKLSLPALETLAVVAYKQPVTAPEVNEIRGVESAGVLGSLLARKLIATAGRKQVIGRPILYKTTKEFLLRFGLKDVAELPSMEEFEKMAAIELEEPDSASQPESASGDAAEPAETEPAFDEAEELESNLPSGVELAEATAEAEEAVKAEEAAETEVNEEVIESVADSTAVMAAEPRAALAETPPTEAAPAEPDSNLQAEIETVPHGQEIEEER